jgi:hypothetical protein
VKPVLQMLSHASAAMNAATNDKPRLTGGFVCRDYSGIEVFSPGIALAFVGWDAAGGALI